MWQPLYGFLNWSMITPIETIEKSLNDKNVRLLKFIVHLQNPINNSIDIGIVIDKIRSFTIGTNEDKLEFSFVGKPESNLLFQIHVHQHSNDIEKSYENTISNVNHILSTWTSQTSVPSIISRIEIIDIINGARWLVEDINPTEYCYFYLDSFLELFPYVKSMRSLYREGRNSKSIYYRFLCFYKIIESAHNGFGLIKLIRKNTGVDPPKRKKIIITQEIVNKANPTHRNVLDSYINKKTNYFLEQNRNLRNKIAHAILKESETEEILDFDSSNEYYSLSSIVNLADLLAFELLKFETQFLMQYEIKLNEENDK